MRRALLKTAGVLMLFVVLVVGGSMFRYWSDKILNDNEYNPDIDPRIQPDEVPWRVLTWEDTTSLAEASGKYFLSSIANSAGVAVNGWPAWQQRSAYGDYSNKERHAHLFDRSWAGDVEAQVDLGIEFRETPYGQCWLTVAANRGHPVAQLFHAKKFVRERDNLEAAWWVTRAARQGLPEAVYGFASGFAGGGPKEDVLLFYFYAAYAVEHGAAWALEHEGPQVKNPYIQAMMAAARPYALQWEPEVEPILPPPAQYPSDCQNRPN